MRPSRLGTLAILLAVGATACGTSQASTPDSAPKADALSTQAPDPTRPGDSAGPAGSLELTSEGGAGPAASLRYVRVETLQGKTVVEKEFRSPVNFTHSPAAGSYRVMTWRRDCTGNCPTQGEKGLSDPVDICGAKAQIRADAPTRMKIPGGTRTSACRPAGPRQAGRSQAG
ncbi:hypothetical protein Q5762_26880 [Streptomyces sp. P9(2023)]|uniref:hypothetical protein n=1 Tax=Streptomyces sp. P9(2023) TaxID=3064394 RepID=UPI0028F454DC|nr:hypothetical protein [Streptomyces sp. P9(2023)]MDT9691892.1 hypothetical protein [Streptomyces sp. P9(2023)]